MLYVSTRGGPGLKDFSRILMEGLAEDGGLYVPEFYPKIGNTELHALRGKSYTEVAFAVLTKFADDIPPRMLRHLIDLTYTEEVFGSNLITPLQKLNSGLSLLKLSEGPTKAFKDIPLQFVARAMEYELESNPTLDELNILGATSGDTGEAAERAVIGKKRIRVFMLSPHGRMSRWQQNHMYSINEPNIHNLVVNGPFDDCQRVVKEVNADAKFKREFRIGAMNSINWARVASQVVYYVYAYLQATISNSEQVSFAVPSGNFGNALAAHVAREMGLPIRKVIVCTNENDVLDMFFKTGTYRVRKSEDVAITSSPSMDIASASNFERFIYDVMHEDTAQVRKLMEQLKTRGEFTLLTSLIGSNQHLGPGRIVSGKCSDKQVIQTIRNVYKHYGTIIDPHTAVGMKVGLEHRENGVPLIVAETAQPIKFPETVSEALGFMPEGFGQLEEMPEHVTRVDPDPEVVKQYIRDHVR